jgi:hypothetical protein
MNCIETNIVFYLLLMFNVYFEETLLRRVLNVLIGISCSMLE